MNGCPLSQSVHRTYYIDTPGDYFLETQSVTAEAACDNFNVKMTCAGGAETASPADSDPLGFAVDAKSGAITGSPERVRDGQAHLKVNTKRQVGVGLSTTYLLATRMAAQSQMETN